MKQAGFGVLAYLIAGVALVGALGGLYWRIDSAAYERGAGKVRQEWDAANAAAQLQAEAERARQDALRATLDKQATGRLANEKKRSGELMASLDAHIRAAGLRPDCRITDELRDDANRALSGGQGVGPGTVPGGPKPPAAPGR